MHFREVGSYFETNALVRDLAGRMFHWAPPRAVAERFREFRASMVPPNHLTWYSARLDIEYSGRENLQFNRPDEPKWITPPPPEAYQEELRKAGSTEGMPDWLLARLNESADQETEIPPPTNDVFAVVFEPKGNHVLVSKPSPLTPPEQEHVVQNACEALGREAPAGWQQIRFAFYSTVGIDSGRFEVMAQDWSEVKLAPPDERHGPARRPADGDVRRGQRKLVHRQDRDQPSRKLLHRVRLRRRAGLQATAAGRRVRPRFRALPALGREHARLAATEAG